MGGSRLLLRILFVAPDEDDQPMMAATADATRSPSMAAEMMPPA
jgi:hypothetical protein